MPKPATVGIAVIRLTQKGANEEIRLRWCQSRTQMKAVSSRGINPIDGYSFKVVQIPPHSQSHCKNGQM